MKAVKPGPKAVCASPKEKKCSLCKQTRPLDAFHKNAGAGDGYRTICRLCRNPTAKRVADSPEDALVHAKQRAATIAARAANQALVKENEALKRRLERLEAIAPPRVELIRKTAVSAEDAIACALASDWHVEEPVAPESVNGLNEYSPEIAKSRSVHFFRNFLRLTNMMARETRIKTVWLGFLGDFITNYLHEENQELNEMPPAEAANYAQGLLASGVRFLLKESSYRLVIDCVAGNHGRLTHRPRAANHSGTNLETFMYFNLAKHFEGNPRVEFRVARSKMLYRQFFERFNMRIIHGDDISYGGGVGGITIPIRKKLAAWDKAIRADLTVLGHFHQIIDGGDFLVNGSLIGFNAYAQSIGASPEDPRQKFFLVHARGGGQKSLSAPIWLG